MDVIMKECSRTHTNTIQVDGWPKIPRSWTRICNRFPEGQGNASAKSKRSGCKIYEALLTCEIFTTTLQLNTSNAKNSHFSDCASFQSLLGRYDGDQDKGICDTTGRVPFECQVKLLVRKLAY